jgi:hypothetical protein
MERHQQETLGSNVKIPGTELIYDWARLIRAIK